MSAASPGAVVAPPTSLNPIAKTAWNEFHTGSLSRIAGAQELLWEGNISDIPQDKTEMLDGWATFMQPGFTMNT